MAWVLFDHSVVVVALALTFKAMALVYYPIVAAGIAVTFGQGLAKAL
jgi:hypothetical protein